MDNFDEFMKQLAAKTKGMKGKDDEEEDELDVDDELAMMEKELEEEKIQQSKQQNVNTNKEVRQQQQYTQAQKVKPQPQIQQQQQQVKQPSNPFANPYTSNIPNKVQQQQQQQQSNKPSQEQDIYSIETENKYHNLKFMKSMSTLEEEKKKCEEIIKYKQLRNKPKDVEYWQAKIKQIDMQISATNNLIEIGKLDIDTYKKVIQQAISFEQGFLKQITQDKSLTLPELTEIKLRITKRIELIQSELSEEVNEDNDEPESSEQQQPEPPQPQQVQPQKVKEPSTATNADVVNQLQSRLNEYKSAYEYFKTNSLTTQEKDALSKTHLLQQLLQKATNNESIPPSSIPKPITKEYIYGYPQQDKVNRLKLLLQEKIQHRNRLNTELQTAEKRLTQLDKASLKKIDQILQNEISKRKTELNAIIKEIDTLKQIASSQWTPAPLIAKKEKEIKKEIINDKIPLNVLQVHIGNTTYDKDKVYVQITITYSGKVQTHKVQETTKGQFDQFVQFTFDKKEFKALYRNNIDIKIYRKKSIRDVVKGDAVVSLEKLKNKISFTTNAEVQLESKRYKPTIEVKVDVRTPCVDAMVESVKVVSLEVVKVYPEFKMVKAALTSTTSASGVKSANIQSNTNAQTTTSKANTNANAIANIKLSKTEIDNPDIIDNLITIQVLDYKINEYTEKIKKIEGRTPKELREFMVKLKVKKTKLEESLGNDISPTDYLNAIKHQLDHDKALYVHFNTSKQPDKAELVKKRIAIMLKEKKEMEAYIDNPQ